MLPIPGPKFIKSALLSVMSVTETQQRRLANCLDDEPTVSIVPLTEASSRSSVLIPVPGSLGKDLPTPRTPKKTKDDIRYYFRPVPREDIRIYFRPVSRLMVERPRVPRTRTVPNVGKPKVSSRRVSPSGEAPSPSGPEVPPKAKARSSGQKNRDIFIAKQQNKIQSEPGRTNQNGSAALPGFDPVLANNGNIPPSSPLSPRITEVVDSSLLPSPLRSKSEAAAESAPEYDDRAERQKQPTAQERQPIQEFQQSIVQEYQQTTLPYKPNSIYGTLPPLPVRLQRNNSQPTPQSPKIVRHRRQDTPYSPNDVGKTSAFDSPELPGETPSIPDQVGRTSVYASSDALPTPIALEIWASEQRRIAHGQPATTQKEKSVAASNTDNIKDRDKTLKKTKSVETRLFRSRRGKSEKKGKEKTDKKDELDSKDPHKAHNGKPLQQSQLTSRPQASRLVSQDHHAATRWDVATLPPSPEIVRPSVTATRSDMNNNPRSDSVSDKMVVDPQLTRAYTDESSTTTTVAVKAKKQNVVARLWDGYLKNVEGLQMVQ